MSYSIGDESDDEFGLHQTPMQVSNSRTGGKYGVPRATTRQSHQFEDPFDDFNAAAGNIQAGKPGNGEPFYNNSLITDDYTGGQSANPLGTATEVKRGPSMNGYESGTYNRYDVYEE